MNRESYRSFGAVMGLLLSLGLMWGLGFTGLIPAAIFGSIGTVAGGISGEQVFDRGRS